MANSYIPPHKRQTSNSVNWRDESLKITTPAEDTSFKSKFKENKHIKPIYSAPNTNQSSYMRISSPNRKTPPIEEEGEEERSHPCISLPSISPSSPSSIVIEKKESNKNVVGFKDASFMWSERLKIRMDKDETEKEVEKETENVRNSKKEISKDNNFIFIPHSTSIIANRRRKANKLMNFEKIGDDSSSSD